MNYEVTIGIPVYKAADYIEKTMESALNQTFDSIEYLIVDDCGNDGTIHIVERFQKDHPRGKDIRIVYNNSNLGVGVTRNRIIDEAEGCYLYFLDSDDLIEPDTIQCLVEKMKQHKADVVYGSLDRADMVNESPIQSYILPDMCLHSDDEMALYAFKNCCTFQISVCNCLMNIDFLHSNRVRFINAMFWEDLAFTCKIVTMVKRAVLLSKITYHYMCRPGSLSHYQDRKMLEKSEILKNASIIDYLKEQSKELFNKPYFPYLCYYLEMNSFYIVCYILRNHRKIVPTFSNSEMQKMLVPSINIWQIIKFRHRCFHNLVFWGLGHLPSSLSLYVIRLFCKIKQ